mgnify:CR=1 FL=1
MRGRMVSGRRRQIRFMVRKKRRVWKAVVVTAVLFAVYVLASLWVSENFLVVREYEVSAGNGGKELRIVVIGDLHDHEFGEDNERLVQKIAAQEPDLILMDGDILNADSPSAQVPATLIRRLRETAPVYYALGNHEIAYMEQDGVASARQLVEELTQAGAVVLDRAYADLEAAGIAVRIGGLYDYAFGPDKTTGEHKALDAPADTVEFLQAFQDTDRLKIMMSHRPDSFIFGDASEVWDVDLVVSAHDHGGQVVLPFLGGMYGGDQGWFPTYIHGLYQIGRIQLFVTSGLGTNRELAPRFNNPPEIAVLKIYW